MKKLPYFLLFSFLLNCNKEPENKIIPKVDVRDNFTGMYKKNGSAKYYSCYKDTGYTGIFALERESSDFVEVLKYDTNGLIFNTSYQTFLIKDIGHIDSTISVHSYYDMNSLRDVLLVYANKDSIRLRKQGSFSGNCNSSYIEITAKK